MNKESYIGTATNRKETEGWFVGEFMSGLLHSDSVGIAYKVLHPGDSGKLHTHSKSTEYTIVIEGEYPVKVGGREIVLKAGDFMVIPANTSLEWQIPMGGKPATVIIIRSPAINDKILL